MSHERNLWGAGHRRVAGIDEVGRGAWAGPLSVGVVVLSDSPRRIPKGLRDSKQLTEETREAMFDRVAAWCAGWAVGHAGPEECDRLGMTAALRLATRRALDQLRPDIVPDAVVLDGTFDFVSPPKAPQLFDADPGTVDQRRAPEVRDADVRLAPSVQHRHRRRCPVRVGGGRVGAGQGDAGPDHAGHGGLVPRLRLRAEQGLPVTRPPAGPVRVRAERRAPPLLGVRRLPPVGAHDVAR